eukprot:gene62753-85815_t
MGRGGENVQELKNKKITVEELSKHRTPDDAWISYKGKVYDVSSWEDHPGGSVIFTHAGDDCTDIFTAFHPATALKDLQSFEIGTLDESIETKTQKQKEFEKSYRELRAKILAMGLFNASYTYYVYKVASNLSLLAVSIICATQFKSFWVHMLGA